MNSRTLEVQSNRSKKSYFIRRSGFKQELPTDCSNFFKMTDLRTRNISQVQPSSSYTHNRGEQSKYQLQLSATLNVQNKSSSGLLGEDFSRQNDKSFILDSSQSNRIKMGVIGVKSLKLNQFSQVEASKPQISDSHSQIPYTFVKAPKKYSLNDINRNTESLQQLLLNNNQTSGSTSQFMSSIGSPKHDDFMKRNNQSINLPSIKRTSLINRSEITSNQNVLSLIKENPELLSNRKKIDKQIHQKDPLYKIQLDSADLRNIRKIKRYRKLWDNKQLKRKGQYRTMKSLIGQSVLNKSLEKSCEYIDKHNSELQKRRFDIKFDDYLRGGDKKLEETIVKQTKGTIASHIPGLKGKGGKQIKTCFEEVFMVQEIYKVSKENQ